MTIVDFFLSIFFGFLLGCMIALQLHEWKKEKMTCEFCESAQRRAEHTHAQLVEGLKNAKCQRCGGSAFKKYLIELEKQVGKYEGDLMKLHVYLTKWAERHPEFKEEFDEFCKLTIEELKNDNR